MRPSFLTSAFDRSHADRMRQSELTPAFDRLRHASYQVRVRGTMFLWGSAGVTVNTTYDKPLLLHVRNNVFGEVITIGTRVAAGTQTTIATLQPGECFSVNIQTISGVFATCTLESNVDCLIQPST
jgi:hypothetical protein